MPAEVNCLATLSWFVRNWAALAIALTCLSLVVFLVLLMTRYIRICLRVFCDTPPPLSVWTVDLRPVHGEVVRFRSFDGTSLRGMYVSATGRRGRGAIVFCHEFGFDMTSCGRYARPLVDAGFDVFTFDFRAHGESSCDKQYRPLQWPSDKDMEDVLGACAHVESLLEAEGRPCDIGLFGISRGAGAAILAASSDPNVKAIICDGAFSTQETQIAFMKKWAHHFARVKLVYENHTETFWRLLAWTVLRLARPRMGCRYPSVCKALRDMLPRPMFFIHGQRDGYINVDQAELLHGVAPEPKYLWIAPDAKHNQSVVVHGREYARRTVAFFARHLAGENVDEALICESDSRVDAASGLGA